jgi:hypothetical protein
VVVYGGWGVIWWWFGEFGVGGGSDGVGEDVVG